MEADIRPPRVRVLVISGSMGSGKTTMLGEASDLLSSLAIAHAAIDADALANGHVPAASGQLIYRNLRAVWENFRALGVNRMLLAQAIEQPDDVARIRDAVCAHDIVVCRLRAPIATMQQRVRTREPGMLQDEFVARVVALDAQLDAAAVEDFSLVNDDEASVTALAREMLTRARWL